MARYGRLLTGAQWGKIGPLLPKRRKRPKGEDLPRTTAKCWKAFCGFCAAALAAGSARGIPLTVHLLAAASRLEGQGVWLTIWRAFLAELNQHGQLDWSESFLDGSFASAKKRARKSEKPSGARARSGWWWSTAKVFLWKAALLCFPERSPAR